MRQLTNIKFRYIGILFIGVLTTKMYAISPSLTENTIEISPFIKMFFGLIFVIALIFFVAWLTRKLKLTQHFSTGYQIKSLATLSLSTREKICLIEVGNKQVLVGVSPGRINQLHVFDEKLSPTTAEPSNANNQFANVFKNALGMNTPKEAK